MVHENYRSSKIRVIKKHLRTTDSVGDSTPSWLRGVPNRISWLSVSLIPSSGRVFFLTTPCSKNYSKWHERSRPVEISEDYETAMKIACYCRVSTRQQKNDSQKSEIRKWLEGNGIDPAHVEWYFDHESGKILSRSEFR